MIVVDLILKLLTFSDRARGVLSDVDREIILPELTVSITSRETDITRAMCNVWFSVKNCFNQPVITQIRATPVDSLLGVICLQPTARDSSTLMKHFTLNPNETMHIRISCAADTSARLLHSILDKLDDCAGAKLIGHLLLEASPVSHVAELENTTISDSFSIAGVLVPGTTFGLSTLSLDFRVAKGDEWFPIASKHMGL